jgi:hypothetical protein
MPKGNIGIKLVMALLYKYDAELVFAEKPVAAYYYSSN